MENTIFEKDSVSFGSASSAQLTHILPENMEFSQNIIIHKFDFDDLTKIKNTKRKTFTYLITSNTTTGKTTLIKNMVRTLNSSLNLSKIYLFSNINTNDYTDTFININFSQENGDYVKDLIEERKTNNKNNIYNEPALIIFDDIIYIYKNKSSGVFDDLFYNSSLINTSIIIATQYPVKFSQFVINNFDYIFAYTPFHNEIKKLYDLYIGNFIDFNEFNLYMKKICVYEFLVINNYNNLIEYYKVENNLSTELLSLSEINNIHKNTNIISNKDNFKLIEKINKNNTLIQKLTEENQKIINML